MSGKIFTHVSLAILLVLSASMLAVAVANPLMPLFIAIDSPQDNQVYPGDSVWLTFTSLPTAGYNFTSFSYSLDGQAAQATDGNTLLTDLPSGSHTIEIYANSTYDSYTYNGMLLDIVYFSTNYSTPWVTFTLVVSAFLAVVLLVLFVNRRSLARGLKSKKTPVFWVGLACFLVFATVLFAPSAWQLTSDYLFPHYLHGAIRVSMFPMFIWGSIFMAVGLALMAFGTRAKK